MKKQTNDITPGNNKPNDIKPNDHNNLAADLTTDLYYAPAGTDPSRDLIKKYNLQGPGKTKSGTLHFKENEDTKYGQYPYPTKVDIYGDNYHTYGIMVYNENTGKPVAQTRRYRAPEEITSDGVKMPYIMTTYYSYEDFHGKNVKDSAEITVTNDDLQPVGQRLNIRLDLNEKDWNTDINFANPEYLKENVRNTGHFHQQNPDIANNTNPEKTPEKEQTKQKPYEKDTSWRDKKPTRRQLDFLAKAGVSGTVAEWRAKSRGKVADEIGKIKKQDISELKELRQSLKQPNQNNRQKRS